MTDLLQAPGAAVAAHAPATPETACRGASMPPVRIVVYGTHSEDWNESLAPTAPVWAQVEGVREVLLAADTAAPLPPPRDDMRTLVLPLMEPHLLACPRAEHQGLLPSHEAVRTLADKGAFAAYAAREGLAHHCPPVFAAPEAAELPCVVKRLDLNAGVGVEVAASREALREMLDTPPWKGFPVVLQGYVPHAHEFATHAVCREGRIVLHRTFRKTLLADARIQRPGASLTSAAPPAAEQHLRVLESFLAPLRYDGPCNFDYVIRDDDSLCVFEINPRLGGSLMKAQNREALAAVLNAIVRGARPLAGGA
ncbi:hypothetical protein V5F44_16400 [Xanthobacter sp. V2C-8]|uniref:hypothetical protein n=1 Tax=Xanthobacter albus TaxID=3119929 RepID=UPI0037290B0A